MAGTFGQSRRAVRGARVKSALDRLEAGRGENPHPAVADRFPMVIGSARGARVKDADGNRYIDMTSFFGVALAGHRNPAVMSAVRVAQGHLVSSMGDVYPDPGRAGLLQLLAGMMPAEGYRGVLSQNGADAVETALKFAAAATGRPGIVSFEGAYHGLSAGALEATWRPAFRKPFEAMLSGRAVFAPWPEPDGSNLELVLSTVERLASSPIINRFGADIGRPGALIVEPIQGRGGVRVPPPSFLSRLASICDRNGIVLITDEIYCGTWRTGTFLASEPEAVVPDIVCLGKALGGGFPISVAMMRPAVADAVLPDHGEAVHTSTFMGWPVSCAAAIATIAAIKRMEPLEAATRIERAVTAAARSWAGKFDFVRGVAGRGAMMGVSLAGTRGMSASEVTRKVVSEALSRGVLLLAEGSDSDVLALMPPLVIGDDDLGTALRIIGDSLAKVAE
ncbi:MAG TPA: aspartate aminotransferase family protein [Myxococcota bacterium]|nr:aspartate aminotransferase family protein [Myxococcota bacterium]